MKLNESLIINANIPTEYNNQNINYLVSLAYVNNNNALSYQRIFVGKCLVVNGMTQIRLDSILLNNAFEVSPKEYNQSFVLNNTLNNLNNTILPIETKEKLIRNTLIRIDFFYETVSQAIRTSLYISTNNIDFNGESPLLVSDKPFINYNSSFINHIPYANTDGYFIGFEFATDSSQPNVEIRGSESEAVKLDLLNFGNYSLSAPLSTLINELESRSSNLLILRGSNANLMYLGGDAANPSPKEFETIGANVITEDVSLGNKIYLNDDLVTIVDYCPSDFYIEFWSDKGWFSTACSVSSTDTSEYMTITDINNLNRRIKTSTTNNYSCSIKRLSFNDARLLSSVENSKFVILYNSKENKSIFCNVETTSITSSKTKGNEITLKLKAIQNKEY